jgi:ubiquinone biosynthesis protein COQ4
LCGYAEFCWEAKRIQRDIVEVMSDSSIERSTQGDSAEEPTWYWKLDFDLLKEAAEIRKRDPKEFRGAVLTFFGFGGRDDGPILDRMRANPKGAEILRDRRPLAAGIMDPTGLADLPEGSLGRAYYEHCRHNGLDPKFLSTESEKVADEFPATEEHRYIYARHRDCHDFWHVLTGYGIDMAGEAGILAWTYAQVRNKGYLLITLLNAVMCTRRGRPDVFKTVWQGYRSGRRSPLVMAIDWEPYLARPLEEVRRELGIEAAPSYSIFHMTDVPGAPDELPN